MKPAAPSSSRLLLQYVDELAASLRRLAPKALAGDDATAVHHCRVVTRRLRAALDLLAPLLRKSQRKPLQRTLRRLRRHLGPLRDLDVMSAALRDLRDANAGGERVAIAWATRLLAEQRRAARRRRRLSPKRLHRKLRHWKKARKTLRRSRANLDDLLRESAMQQLQDFARQARDLLPPPGHPLPPGGKPPRPASSPPRFAAPACWHPLRIAGKRLRYTLEMAAAAGHQLPPQTTHIFKQMQDALGLWHDHVVLMQTLLCLAAEGQLPTANPPLMAAVLRLLQEVDRRAARQLSSFARIWRQHGERLASQIGACYREVPPARAAASSRTGAIPHEPPSSPGDAAMVI